MVKVSVKLNVCLLWRDPHLPSPGLERSHRMAIDRHDRDDPVADYPPGVIHGDKGHGPGAERPVLEERRSRGELYADLRSRDYDPERQPPTGSPDASHRTDDGGWEWKGLRLSPEANRIADQQLSARRTAEGRADDGSYGDHGITPAMRRVEAGLEHGTLVPDTEKFALKSPDRFKEKLAKMMEIEPDRSPSELSTEIHDGIRYTFMSDPDHYSVSVDTARRDLSGRGYELVNFKPGWTGKEYKGINSQWKDRVNGQAFEVQFHTPDSWEAKQKTHDAYERIMSPETAPVERARLCEYQREISSQVPIPSGALGFLPYKLKGE
jgi:hypothetical protein